MRRFRRHTQFYLANWSTTFWEQELTKILLTSFCFESTKSTIDQKKVDESETDPKIGSLEEFSLRAKKYDFIARKRKELENLERSFFIFLRDSLCLFSMKCGRFRILDKVSLL